MSSDWIILGIFGVISLLLGWCDLKLAKAVGMVNKDKTTTRNYWDNFIIGLVSGTAVLVFERLLPLISALIPLDYSSLNSFLISVIGNLLILTIFLELLVLFVSLFFVLGYMLIYRKK